MDASLYKAILQVTFPFLLFVPRLNSIPSKMHLLLSFQIQLIAWLKQQKMTDQNFQTSLSQVRLFISILIFLFLMFFQIGKSFLSALHLLLLLFLVRFNVETQLMHPLNFSLLLTVLPDKFGIAEI